MLIPDPDIFASEFQPSSPCVWCFWVFHSAHLNPLCPEIGVASQEPLPIPPLLYLGERSLIMWFMTCRIFSWSRVCDRIHVTAPPLYEWNVTSKVTHYMYPICFLDHNDWEWMCWKDETMSSGPWGATSPLWLRGLISWKSGKVKKPTW